MTAPVRVAIIGGGCASMAAAFELSRPEHAGRYEVTVYQQGWRLGGKGASGRGPAGRIEEHGLHLWMGWYENAFRLMRECYAELGRDPSQCPIADWRDAFAPASLIGVAEHRPDGRWVPWKVVFPPSEGLPGDAPGDGPHWTVRDYMLRLVSLVRMLIDAIRAQDGVEPADDEREEPRESPTAPAAVLDALGRILGYGELATLAGMIHAIGLLEVVIGSLGSYPQNAVLRFLDALGRNAQVMVDARLQNQPGLRRVWYVLDLTLATLRGGVRFSLMTDPRGFDAVDDYDCREWLRLNGASEAALESGYLRALYDFGFSYEDGNPSRPRISAGQALRGMARACFTYRGAFFWRMQAGMGDIVFAPFYEVLRKRGVRFAFFNRLANVRLADPSRNGGEESPHVEALEIDVQAEVIGGREYEPLVDVGGVPCWPSAPDFRQLVDGARMDHERWDFESHWDQRKVRRRTLRVGEDFDLVVLGVPVGVVPYVCRDLVERDPRWRAMVDHVRTVATQAFQVWLDADMHELGWNDGQVALCGFVEPFDTWADMRHLIGRETWQRPPRALAYFCSVLLDEDFAARNGDRMAGARERVRENAVRFLNRDIPHLWPHAARSAGEFRWELLAHPDGASPEASGEARFASQFWSANVSPSERYTLSLPGSAAYRISPLDRTYDNLTIAGDWTDCGFNAGCVEAAVMSGRLAAHAIAQSPKLEEIVGYDHP
jgi:uncharacterized protein with NAD-binding domain and iron-sulfur cluster